MGGLAASQTRLLEIFKKLSETDETEDPYKYDVVISFAGEDREHAKAIADFLTKRNIEVFYDEYSQSQLWGKNLYDYLSDVYQNARFFCIVLLSQHYARKMWTNHERKSAQARALKEKHEYVLPIKIDDTPVPGFLDTIAYLDLRTHDIGKICDILLSKLLVAIDRYLRNAPSAEGIIAQNIANDFQISEEGSQGNIAHRQMELSRFNHALNVEFVEAARGRSAEDNATARLVEVHESKTENKT